MSPVQIFSNALAQAKSLNAPSWLVESLKARLNREGDRLAHRDSKSKPLQFIGWQDRGDGSRFALFNLLIPIGNYPKHTTISGPTAKRLFAKANKDEGRAA